MKKQILYTGLLILLVTGCHCENTKSFKMRGGEIKITNWNVQTFFDTTTDGSEYRDFKNNSKWTVQKYETRLQNLVQAIFLSLKKSKIKMSCRILPTFLQANGTQSGNTNTLFSRKKKTVQSGSAFSRDSLCALQKFIQWT